MELIKLPVEERRKLYYSMLRIRRIEERIDADYLQDRMRTPIHLSTGQEAIAVGACSALRQNDTITSNHRSHGHYLAKGGNFTAMMAELHGRETGCSKGFGGSMHLIDTSVGHLGSSSIVGGGIPMGTGHALAYAIRKEDSVSVIFLGDGASEEGVLYESLNFAVLKRLPAVYIMENNGMAICSPLENRQPGSCIFHTAYPPEQLSACTVDGNDVEAVYSAVVQAVQRARNGKGPSFIECVTFRMIGHMGCATQDPEGYKSPEVVASWKEKCPVACYERCLQEAGVLSETDIACFEQQIADEINCAFALALDAPFPDPQLTQGTVYL